MLDEVHAQQQGPDGVVELLPERERFGVRRVPKIGTFLVQDPGMGVDLRLNLPRGDKVGKLVLQSKLLGLEYISHVLQVDGKEGRQVPCGPVLSGKYSIQNYSSYFEIHLHQGLPALLSFPKKLNVFLGAGAQEQHDPGRRVVFNCFVISQSSLTKFIVAHKASE